MTHLPKHFPLPIHFQRRATHVCGMADAALVRNFTVVEERPALSEITVAGRVGRLPSMDDFPAQIDKVDGLIRSCTGSEERETREGASWIVATEAHAATFDRDWFNSCLSRRCVLLGECLAACSGGAQDAEPSGRASYSNETSPCNLGVHSTGPSHRLAAKCRSDWETYRPLATGCLRSITPGRMPTLGHGRRLFACPHVVR